MVITGVERKKKNIKRFSVFVDGSYCFSIDEDDFLGLGLYDTSEITIEAIENIRNIVNFKSAKSVAIRYLALKLRCEKEVRDKLEDLGYEEEVVERVVNELKSMGYINDIMYANKYLFDRSKLKPKSKRLLRLELIHKGISEELADTVISEYQVDESSVAENLIRKKFGKYHLNDDNIIKKVYSFLLHRGFSYEQISKALKNVKEDVY